MTDIALRHLTLPRTEAAADRPPLPPTEYEARAAELYRRAQTEWAVVYGDREHAANLLFFCGHDPRFEEALLLLGPGGRRVLVVGNEGVDYARHTSPGLDLVLCQSFSLLAQPRGVQPRLDDALRAAGLRHGDSAGIVGWKYATPAETDAPEEPAFVPAHVVSTVRAVTGQPPVDCTRHVMHAETGMRSSGNTAAQIAAFEWGAAHASAAVLRVLAGTQPGMSERDAAKLAGYDGEVLTAHLMLSGDDVAVVGLRSPTGRVLREGNAVTTAIGHSGGLCARSGVLMREPDDEFVAGYVAPYFRALKAWYESVAVGASAGLVYDAVMDVLGQTSFRSLLNPGHLVSLDEWVNSPFEEGSTHVLRSGMALQCDIIPGPMPPSRALNAEDSVALADEALRSELARDHPELWRRIESRRAFVRSELGIALSDDVLPLSDSLGYVAPFWLDDSLVCTAIR